MQLSGLDIGIVLAYLAGIFLLAQWVSRAKAGHDRDAEDYFLAGKALPWWAIGASLIAANISAEQIIGMSGSGYAIGLAIASYEWMAAATLLIVGKWFLPVFLRNRIFTMPPFLEQRYGRRIRTVMAVFWIGLYVFVNLTSILWLGSLAIAHVSGVDQTWALLGLAAFALAYQIHGGLRAVALTDVVQVVLLVLGALLLAGIMLERIGGDAGMWGGLRPPPPRGLRGAAARRRLTARTSSGCAALPPLPGSAAASRARPAAGRRWPPEPSVPPRSGALTRPGGGVQGGLTEEMMRLL